MQSSNLIRVGGVPEHFNLPWHLALENDLFSSSEINVDWITFKGGTGAMCQALREDEVDVCVILTEGIVRDIYNGNPSKIISKYIDTPLIWGVHTANDNELRYYDHAFGKKYAASRFGSGSHLMPHVDAMIKAKHIKDDQFVVVKNLEGALSSLKNGETDVFYWEKYTTKPYVDSGELRLLGEFITPWPCFVLAASERILKNNEDGVRKLLSVIQFACSQFVRMPDSVKLLSDRYSQKYEDIENWYYSTQWSSNAYVSPKMIDNVLHSLNKTKLIDLKNINVDQFVQSM